MESLLLPGVYPHAIGGDRVDVDSLTARDVQPVILNERLDHISLELESDNGSIRVSNGNLSGIENVLGLSFLWHNNSRLVDGYYPNACIKSQAFWGMTSRTMVSRR